MPYCYVVVRHKVCTVDTTILLLAQWSKPPWHLVYNTSDIYCGLTTVKDTTYIDGRVTVGQTDVSLVGN